MIHRLGNPQPFVPEGTALTERAQLGMARSEEGQGIHGGQHNLAEALMAPRLVEGRQALCEIVDRPPIVALVAAGTAEAVTRLRLPEGIPAGRGERQCPLRGGDGLVIRTHDAEMV